VLEIQSGGFQNCNQLVEIYFPSLIKVHQSGFQNCSKLTKFYLPNLKSVEEFAFQSSGITELNSVSLDSVNLKPVY
jgi:hypothetical protein